MNTPPDPATVASEPGALSDSSEGDEAFCSSCGGSFPLDVDVCPKDGARLAKLKSRPDSLLGRVFEGRYEIRMALGQGGMGTVYRGWQLSVDREVAIKVIHPKLATDRTSVKRFLREARLSSRLSQPNVVNVYDFGQTDDGILYIVMELLRGHTLARALDAQRPLPLKRVVAIALQLCDALDAAHGQSIVHRDLKPGNIIILDDPPGRDLIKVLDFGLAKTLVTDTSSVVTQTNAILGTPLYMAPEQIQNKPTDHRSDLYALGCILYQMVSGKPPFTGDSVNTVLARHLGDQPEPLPIGVPGVLATAIEKLMEKDPVRRTASAAAVRTALERAKDEDPGDELADTTPDLSDSMESVNSAALAITAPAPAVAGSIAPPRPRRAAPIMLAVLGAIAIAGVMFGVLRRDSSAPSGVDALTTAAPADAAPAGSNALQPAIIIDAPVPIDAAAVATPPDATPKRPRPRPDAGVTGDDGLEFQRPKR